MFDVFYLCTYILKYVRATDTNIDKEIVMFYIFIRWF